jgi:hypothetical protein
MSIALIEHSCACMQINFSRTNVRQRSILHPVVQILHPVAQNSETLLLDDNILVNSVNMFKLKLKSSVFNQYSRPNLTILSTETIFCWNYCFDACLLLLTILLTQRYQWVLSLWATGSINCAFITLIFAIQLSNTVCVMAMAMAMAISSE